MRRSALRSAVLVSSLALLGAATMAASAWAASGTSTISGAVWNDADRNGAFGSGESPFANTPLNVYAGTTYVSGGYTDANGHFQVGGLADGTYTVEIDPQTWSTMRDAWVPTTTGSLRYQQTVTVAGSAVADFGLRQVVRSTSMSAPMSTYRGATGLIVNSFDDVVPAQALYDDLTSVQLRGPEASTTTLDFDSPNTMSDTVSSVSGGPPYSNFHATMYVTFDSWVTKGDMILVHEYGHSWSNYNAYITQQDATYSSYLQARGLSGNPKLSTSWMWEPSELIAEDYRQLFGTPNAASYPQSNTDVPPAASVPGLKSFLQNTYSASSTSSSPTAAVPTVTGVSPSVAPAAGGTTVTVTGSGFSGSGSSATAVHVGGAAAAFTVVSATQLSVVLPAGVGTQDITVTTGSGTSSASSADRLTYVPAPTVSSLSPSTGPIRGGTTVTVYGTGFSGSGITGLTVTFGGIAASQVTVVSATQLTVVSPARSSTGGTQVVVTTSGGTSTTSTASLFTYKRK